MKISKMLLSFFLGVTVFTGIQAQESVNPVEINEPSDFFVTAPMTSYPKVDPNTVTKREVPRGGLSAKNIQKGDFVSGLSRSSSSVDPIVQKASGTKRGKDPIVNFDGIDLDVSPPDPTAAVGPDHIVQMTNGLWSVYDKNGVEAAGFPKDINDPLGGENAGDPVVLYDREADRWFISQFQLPTDNQFKIAVSTTSDPTGTYAVYSYDVPENDYPHYGIYGNSYIVTGNFSPNDTGRFYAFNREKMLNGDPSAEIATLTLPDYVGTGGFQAPQPVHSEGAGIASGPAPIVWFQDDAWPGISEDHVKVWDLTIDWNNPGGATVSSPLEIQLAAFDSFLEGTGGDSFAVLEQPGTPQRIDPIVFAMYFQAHRYNFGSHESLVFNFPVEVVDGSRISGIRWVELRRATSTDDWTLFQEGTYQDAGGESVFLSAIGMDQEGNIGLGYTKTGDTTFPSLYYTGRMHDDPTGQMTVAETLIVEGNSSVTSNSRYGDYSQLVRDPEDDLTFWFTAEYSGEPRKTRIASFRISDLLSIDELAVASSNLIIASVDNRIFNLQLETSTTSDILRLSVVDTSGKIVFQDQISKASNTSYKATLDLSNLSAGTYLVQVGNAKTKLTKRILVK